MHDQAPTKSTANEMDSREMVFQAVAELRRLDQPATGAAIAELTGLKRTIVDDRLRILITDKRLHQRARGYYEVVEFFNAPRVISKTVLPSGMVVFDIGDDVIALNPQESRVLAELCIGAAHTALMIHTTNQHLFLAHEIASKVEKLDRQLKTAQEESRKHAAQLELYEKRNP